MRRIMTTVVAVALLATAVPMFGQVQSVTGYNKVTVPAQSDVIVSVPFTQKPEGTFTVATDGVGDDTLSVDEDITTEYEGAYYIRFTSGDAKGLWSTIKSSNTTTESVELEDTSMLSGGKVAEGDTFKIIKHNTLESVFPDKMKDRSFIASTKPGFQTIIETEILMWTGSTGKNQSPEETFYYLDGQWVDSSRNPADSKPIGPDSAFVIRNKSDKALLFLAQGSVNTGTRSMEIATYSDSDDDIQTTTGRPVPVKLEDLNLGGTDAFESSTSGFGTIIEDELLIFDNDASGFNKSPISSYYFRDGKWRYSNGDPVNGQVEIAPSQGFIIRKASGTPSQSTWSAPAPF